MIGKKGIIGKVTMSVLLSATIFTGVMSDTVEAKDKKEETDVTEYSLEDMEKIEKEQKKVIKELKKKDKKIGKIIIKTEEKEEEIEAIQEVIKINQKEIEKVEKKIKGVEEEIEELEESIHIRVEIIASRMKRYQEKGDIKYIDVILGADSFQDFIGRATSVSTILEADKDIIKELDEDKNLLDKKLKEEEDLKKDLEEIKKANEEQEKDLEDQVKKLKKDRKKLENEVDKLGMDNKELSKIVKEIKKQLNMKEELGDGFLEWPTDGGYISSPMGKRVHPITGEVGRMHKGIDIARTDRSTSPPIYAAEDGTVVTASNSTGGYGKMVMILHEDGIQTLYAHLSTIKVKTGQEVKRGQAIGIMGTTGMSTGIHLHFEVYDNGVLKNPVGYLEKEDKKKKEKKKKK